MDGYTRRITPAHAGKTNTGHRPSSHSSDHPRACGENSTNEKVGGTKAGSPPRMRGKPPLYLFTLLFVRITPAHAGKTSMVDYAATCVPDHPRACGENLIENSAFALLSGSPPRMRGKPGAGRGKCGLVRITPAHAGKTLTGMVSGVASADHPRACGENAFPGFAITRAIGSPPRMRGKPIAEPHGSEERRITPAHAGKTHTA